MRPRVLVALVLVPMLVACGLSIKGTALEIDGGIVPATFDGQAPIAEDGALLPIGPNDADATIPEEESKVRCADVCTGDGQTCKDNTCVIVGKPNAAVKCPAGVACDVSCVGASACKEGVDCRDATSCKIKCDGSDACMNGNGVRCGGKTCDVTCNGSSACKAGIACTATDRCTLDCVGASACEAGKVTCAGRTCDVGCTGDSSCKAGVACTGSVHCGIRCIGKDACATGGGVSCTSAQGDCKVACGAADGPSGECRDGVKCTAATNCNVTCLGSNTCRDARLVVNAPGDNTVTCGDGENCNGGITINGKTATVRCGTGNACGKGIACSAKTCDTLCDSSNPTHCCAPVNSTCTTRPQCKLSSDLNACN